jgi:hypothetical protein
VIDPKPEVPIKLPASKVISLTRAGGTEPVDVTLKLGVARLLLSAVPPGVVTTTSPNPVAPAPTVARIWLAEFELMAAAAPAIVTDDALLKFDPLMVTWVVPAGPLVGVKLLRTGFTLNVLKLVAVPTELVTVTLPVVAPDGTVAAIFVSEFMANVAWLPLNATFVAVLNLVPLIVTVAPTAPLVGEIEEIVGAPETVTVNGVPLVAVPAEVVTVMEPVVAVEGTVAVI